MDVFVIDFFMVNNIIINYLINKINKTKFFINHIHF